VIIVDGSHLLHRCRYNTLKIGWAEYCKSFLDLFLAILKTLNERRAVICWNVKGSCKKRFADNIEDESVKQSYLSARNWLHNGLPRLGFCSLMIDGIETGETAYWLINSKLKKLNRNVNYLITTDKNWIQLINEQWYVYNPLIGETVTYQEFCKKYASKPYYIMRQALLGSHAIQKCYGVTEANVDYHAKKIMNGTDLLDSKIESINLNNFVADNKLTQNMWVMDLGLLSRGERRKLHIKYGECIAKVKQPSLFEQIRLGCEISAPSVVFFEPITRM
jgi:5'-3' exonuclease